MPITGGPYLQATLLCEKALQETDGVVSVIRIVDRWFVSGPTEEMLQTAIQATMVLMFKSGFHRGPERLTITAITPRDERILPAMEIPVHFEGDEDRGINVLMPMLFPVHEPGIYWFGGSTSWRDYHSHTTTRDLSPGCPDADAVQPQLWPPIVLEPVAVLIAEASLVAGRLTTIPASNI
jgi:hypothetical protein